MPVFTACRHSYPQTRRCLAAGRWFSILKPARACALAHTRERSTASRAARLQLRTAAGLRVVHPVGAMLAVGALRLQSLSAALQSRGSFRASSRRSASLRLQAAGSFAAGGSSYPEVRARPAGGPPDEQPPQRARHRLRLFGVTGDSERTWLAAGRGTLLPRGVRSRGDSQPPRASPRLLTQPAPSRAGVPQAQREGHADGLPQCLQRRWLGQVFLNCPRRRLPLQALLRRQVTRQGPHISLCTAASLAQ